MKKTWLLGVLLAPLAVAGFIGPTTKVAHADGIDGVLDPLHGFCAAATCVDNGTNTPLGSQPFSFTVSPGNATATGDLLMDILVPNNLAAPANFPITGGPPTGTATKVDTAWTSGQLDTFLGISASPTNPIGAFLPSTQKVDPGATGFFVFQADLGSTTLQPQSNASPTPLWSIANLPVGSYVVAFLNTGTTSNPNWIATANSGALFVPVPAAGAGVPGLIAACGALLGLARRRRQKVA